MLLSYVIHVLSSFQENRYDYLLKVNEEGATFV